MSIESNAKTILYIEDDCKEPFDTDPFFSELKDAKFHVEVAKIGDDAWNMLKKMRYDCIILDIMLPHKGENIPPDVPRYRTGIHLFERLRNGEFPENQNTPVIVVSAIADMEDVKRVKQDLKPFEYLEKPIKPPMVVKAVKKALETINDERN